MWQWSVGSAEVESKDGEPTVDSVESHPHVDLEVRNRLTNDITLERTANALRELMEDGQAAEPA